MAESVTCLVHIGYHKTATTWFQSEVVRSHPHMQALATPAELAESIVYPDLYEPLRSATSAQTTRPCRKAAFLSTRCAPVSGPPFAGGYDAKRVADRLAMALPNARIWIVVRNQVDLLTSLYNHAVAWDGNTMPVEVFLRDDRPAIIPGVRLDHFCFDRMVQLYHERFGADQVLISAYETLWSIRQLHRSA